MRAGNLDRRITIQESTETLTATGFPTQTWSDVATVWASRQDVTGNERFRAGQVMATRTAKFRIRYRAIGPTARLVEADGTTWDITGVAEIGRREGVEITAEVRADNGT